MGSGAKIALLALLILMVVAIAKFINEEKKDNTLYPLTTISQDSVFGQKIQVFDLSETCRIKSLNELLAQMPNSRNRSVQKIMMIVYSEPIR